MGTRVGKVQGFCWGQLRGPSMGWSTQPFGVEGDFMLVVLFFAKTARMDPLKSEA